YKQWRLVPAPKRGEILFRAAELLVERKEEYAKDMTREMGKILAETRGDVQEAIDMTYYMAGEGRRLFGQTTPSELPNKFAMSVRQSIGVCGLITPWNFPMAIPSWKIMPALICGKDRKSTRLNSSHEWISYAVFCLKKKKNEMCMYEFIRGIEFVSRL